MASSEKYNNIHQPRSQILANNFIGGLAWGVGSVIGATLIVGAIGIIVSKTAAHIDFIGYIVESLEEGRMRYYTQQEE